MKSITRLFHDKDGVVELLTLKKWMNIIEKNIQLKTSVSVRNNHSHIMFRTTFRSPVTPANLQRSSSIRNIINGRRDERRNICPTD